MHRITRKELLVLHVSLIGNARGLIACNCCGAIKVDPTTYARSVFVSNLLWSIDEEALEAKFKGCGVVDEVRLVRKASGQSKGFAYVQFNFEDAVPAALALDRADLGGRPM